MKQPDENWDLEHLVQSLTNKRWKEKVVGYAESHDQAIVGDKTLAMWLLGEDIYHGMNHSGLGWPGSINVERGVALHKLIRLLTFSLAGEAYLNFMGNEFGHPEWIDFPRKENGFAYDFCR